MIRVESVLCIDRRMMDPVTMGEVRSQVMLPHQVGGEELCDEKTQELLGQISEPDG